MNRSVAAIVAGYLVFGLSAAALFAASGQDPHAPPSLLFAVVSTVYGVVFAGVGGFTTASLAARNPAVHARILASIIAVVALFSLLVHARSGWVWVELSTLFLMAPAVIAGGRVAVRRAERTSPTAEVL